MKVIKEPKAIQDISEYYRISGKKIGFVPTMGFLHDGHISLINRARSECDVLNVSIFVNPAQFLPNEDFNKYPRDFLKDYEICNRCGCDYLFYPDTTEMYPNNFLTTVKLKGITDKLEGKHRPGHFIGVATVVLKLINIIKPHRIYLGQKDGQQSVLIKKMMEDLNVDTELVICDTVREENGLAKSSRNIYLSFDEKEEAAVLYNTLKEGRQLLLEKTVNTGNELETLLAGRIETNSRNSRLQYIAVTDMINLEPIENLKDFKGDVMISVAAFFGATRLIDNIIVRL
jgi:pantoate--beta-alanine ligase